MPATDEVVQDDSNSDKHSFTKAATSSTNKLHFLRRYDSGQKLPRPKRFLQLDVIADEIEEPKKPESDEEKEDKTTETFSTTDGVLDLSRKSIEVPLNLCSKHQDLDIPEIENKIEEKENKTPDGKNIVQSKSPYKKPLALATINVEKKIEVEKLSIKDTIATAQKKVIRNIDGKTNLTKKSVDRGASKTDYHVNRPRQAVNERKTVASVKAAPKTAVKPTYETAKTATVSSNQKSFVAPHKPVDTKNDDKFVVPRPPSGIRSRSDKPKSLVINGKVYHVFETLGKGGSSEVFLVSDAKSKLLAVKCVNLAEVDETTKNEHLNEIEHLLRMQNSEHVIQLFDHEYVEKQKLLFVVMENGDTDLSQYLKHNRSSLNPFGILCFWVQMLLAVKSMHENNIIHRDLKPANFLLVKGKLKLIDFGIASSIQTDQTSVLKENPSGTFSYMSPEAFEDLGVGMVKIGRKSDVWSLGCILYNFLYGKTPYQEFKNPYSKFKAISNPNHKIQFTNLPGMPRVLLESCKRCLVHDVKQRASVDELLEMTQNTLNQIC